MGRICFLDQLNSIACSHSYGDWKIFTSNLRSIQHGTNLFCSLTSKFFFNNICVINEAFSLDRLHLMLFRPISLIVRKY